MGFNIVTGKKVSSKLTYLSLFVTFNNQSSFICLYIAFHVSLSLKDPLTSNKFRPFKWINQGPYLVGMHGIHFRFHGLKSFFRINIRYQFHVIGKLIKYEQLIIFNFHEKSMSYWCMTCPIRYMKFFMFLKLQAEHSMLQSQAQVLFRCQFVVLELL